MNQLVVTLIVILLPGIIANVICDKVTVHSKWTSFKFSLYAFVLGIGCYVALQVIYYLVNMVFSCSLSPAAWSHLEIWKSAMADNPTIPPKEVIFATFLSLPISLFTSFLINHKIFNKIAQYLHISSKYGDENLFSYYLNAQETDWLYIRDIENGLTYQGRIVSYSETEKMQEIVMSEVTVFRYDDSVELYSVPTIYLTKEVGKFIIESIPNELLGDENDNEKTS